MNPPSKKGSCANGQAWLSPATDRMAVSLTAFREGRQEAQQARMADASTPPPQAARLKPPAKG